MEGQTLSLCFQRIHTSFFIRLIVIVIQEKYKDKTKTTILAKDRYIYMTGEGGVHEQGSMRCHHTNAHHLKPKASTSCPSASTYTHTHPKSPPPLFRYSIFRTNQRTDLARLAVNATMSPHNAMPPPSCGSPSSHVHLSA
jgi:hypothetical protein